MKIFSFFPESFSWLRPLLGIVCCHLRDLISLKAEGFTIGTGFLKAGPYVEVFDDISALRVLSPREIKSCLKLKWLVSLLIPSFGYDTNSVF